jgi:FlaA1/EpsC-like NDP-sugar epimerase
MTAPELNRSGSILERFRSSSARMKRWVMVASDFLLITFSAWLAFSLRLGELFEPSLRVFGMMLAASGVSVIAFQQLGLHRTMIRFVGPRIGWRLALGMGFAALVWVVIGFMTQFAGYENVPRSMPLIFAVVGWLLLGGSRFAARWVFWRPGRPAAPVRRILIYGADPAGRQLVTSLRAGTDMTPVAFIDDDKSLAGREIDGLRVYSPGNLGDLARDLEVDEVIVTTDAAPALRRREITEEFERRSIRVRVLPTLADIVSGRHVVNLVREVDIDDLLGRDPVAPDPALMSARITDRVVLVTGAGGSIGSEICRQVAALAPRQLILLESSEHALYEIDRSLAAWEACEVVPILGSVQNRALVEKLLREYSVQTLYHAAAHKHVPLVESNPIEGSANNVLGTLTVAEAAYHSGVATFVLVSSDKAVRSTSVMGATKRWAELIVQDLALRARTAGSGQCFCAVRFGNVLGSSGSVVPLFEEQIARGGPLTVTHPDVTRYFMSVHEAVALVIQAGSMAQGGEIFLIDMGEPVLIADLARRMVTLAGFTVRDQKQPSGDIEIVYTGLRPGEKLFEELLISSQGAATTDHPKILKGREPTLDHGVLKTNIEQLQVLINRCERVEIVDLLLAVALEAQYPSKSD